MREALTQRGNGREFVTLELTLRMSGNHWPTLAPVPWCTCPASRGLQDFTSGGAGCTGPGWRPPGWPPSGPPLSHAGPHPGHKGERRSVGLIRNPDSRCAATQSTGPQDEAVGLEPTETPNDGLRSVVP